MSTLPIFDDRERRAIREAQTARARDAQTDRIRREVENVERAVKNLRLVLDSEKGAREDESPSPES